MSVCSFPISISYVRFHIQSSIPISKPVISTNFVPASFSKTSLINNFRTLRCCSSSSPLIELDESPSTKIFIKGLSLSTTERDLKKAFSKFGEVNRVKILTDKRSGQPLGFAYLWFTDEESVYLALNEMNGKVFGATQIEESVNLALSEMNGKFFEGRSVYVTTTKPGPSKILIKTSSYMF